MIKSQEMQPCMGCGALVEGGTAGCQALFDILIARDFSDALYFGVHRMAVDTYALQHPDRYCASAKSLAAHLVGLQWTLEEHGDPAIGSESIRRWLDGKRPLDKPDLPSFRGSLTIADVVDAKTPVEYREAVGRWAESVWASYSSLHSLARHWARQAFASQANRRRRSRS